MPKTSFFHRSISLLVFSFLILLPVAALAQDQPPAWSAGTYYAANARVSYNAGNYKCLQPHTAIASWEPPNAPALWQVETGGTTATPTPTPTSGTAIFRDDFETNRGWTVNPTGGDTATAGVWERGAPEPSRVKGVKQPETAHGGANVLVTGRAAFNDVNGGVTSVQSPTIALPANAANLNLSFWYSFAHDARATSADYFRVKIIGNTTEIVFNVSGRATIQNARWRKQTANVSRFAGQTVRILFEAADGANNNVVEAAVDTVEITQSAAAGGAFPARVFAPYVDVLLYPPFPLAQTAAATGVKYYTLAFITNGASQCRASWGGVIALGDNHMLADINNLRAAGGNVIVSFGGANGTELGNSCQTVESLTAQYKAVIDAYNLTQVDFDIEGGAITDAAANNRRNKAIALLQTQAAAQGRELNVSYTLPAMPFGLTQPGVALLQNAAANGVNVSIVNIMAMDYGAADPNRMGQNAIDAANAAAAQIQPIFPGKSATEIKKMIGVTPMIGLNDVVPEVFTLADAQMLLNYANQNNIGRLSMWSMTRDKQCPGAPQVSPVCSGVAQQPFAFSNIFKSFTQ